MPVREKEADYDIVVIGGGLSGVCAAIAAAREGSKVALVQNRSVFGGNASSEIRMHVAGANCLSSKPNLRETGILEEILLENKRRNPYANFPTFDMIIWEKVYMEPNITAYLNTNIEDVGVQENRITCVTGHQNSTETKIKLNGRIFIDATGHGTVGVMAGAAHREGSESKYEFQEPSAPEEPNRYTMGNTIMFHAVDRGEPVPFIKPAWANTYTEEDLKFRPHVDQVSVDDEDGIHNDVENAPKGKLPEFSNMDVGYWWCELGGDYDDIIGQGEELRDDLLKCIYGVWDHLKNGGDHGVENYDLAWVGMVPGYRESRRLEGDYILNENDIRSNRIFPDAVAYGGWPMDVHIAGGMHDLSHFPSKVYNFDGCYSIPYRCYYSRNLVNLMMAGRDISTSKMAFGSIRVMGTCSVGGQAVGTAAALAVKYQETPRQIGKNHIRELQQELLKNDCYIPGFENTDENDLARTAAWSAASETSGCPAQSVAAGPARPVGESKNYWESSDLSRAELTGKLKSPARIREVRLTFDTDLSHEIQPSMLRNIMSREVKGMPHELVKDYDIRLIRGGEVMYERKIRGNYQRLNVIRTGEVPCDSIEIKIHDTWGNPTARIQEVRLYD